MRPKTPSPPAPLPKGEGKFWNGPSVCGRTAGRQGPVDAQGDPVAVLVAVLPVDVDHDRPAQQVEGPRVHVFAVAGQFVGGDSVQGSPSAATCFFSRMWSQ